MADRICDNCMTPVPPGGERCPKCGIGFENQNPGGALPNGWLLAERYTIGRYIAIDGEGVCYAAIDGDTMQRVLIKEFMPVTLCAARSEDGDIQPKPGNEVLFKTTRMDYADLYSVLMRLGPAEGLVQVLDVLEENNTAYAVLQKTEGPTLAEYLTRRQNPMEPARALALLRPVLSGVERMHNANLVHRGISPDNIILESGGTAKLCGYGILALRQQGSELKPKLYPGYSAPEQYAASEFEGRYTDSYAIGALLYRLLTGTVPQAADRRRAQDNLRPARAITRDVPPFMSSGIARAMRLAPAERIQNVADLRAAFSGEGGREARGPLGLTRQQLIVGALALGAIVVLLGVILVITLFMGGEKDASSSVSQSVSVPPPPPVSSSVPLVAMPKFVALRYESVAQNDVYTSKYMFAEPTYEYSLNVEEGRIIAQVPAEGELWDGKTPVQLVVSLGAEPVTIPDFTAVFTPQADAEAALKAMNIKYEVVRVTNNGEAEPGMVTGTNPAAGSQYIPNKDNDVVLYIAGEVNTVPLPDLVGEPLQKALDTLSDLGITPLVEHVENSVGYRQAGTVQSTQPEQGQAVATAVTNVTLYVYEPFYMPNLAVMYPAGTNPTEMYQYLKGIGVQYRVQMVANTDPAQNGLLQQLDYVVNAEVTAETVVIVYLYNNAPPAQTS